MPCLVRIEVTGMGVAGGETLKRVMISLVNRVVL